MCVCGGWGVIEANKQGPPDSYMHAARRLHACGSASYTDRPGSSCTCCYAHEPLIHMYLYMYCTQVLINRYNIYSHSPQYAAALITSWHQSRS